MLAGERLSEIREQFGSRVDRLIPLELDGEALRLILYLEDGTNLRVTEQWQGPTLERYSYYRESVIGGQKSSSNCAILRMWDFPSGFTQMCGWEIQIQVLFRAMSDSLWLWGNIPPINAPAWMSGTIAGL